MSSRPRRIPSYRLHKPTGQAVVRLDGKDRYLGRHGTEASHESYRRLIAEWLALPAAPRPAPGPAGARAGPAIDDLLVAYWDRHVVAHYVKDGRPTSEQGNLRQALRFLRRLYGRTPARDFGPLALKAVRGAMIDAGRCRGLINKDIHRIRGMFRWAVGEELFPGPALQGLLAVAALEKGRSPAKERPPISPVAESVVLATLPHLSAQVAAMVRLQLLTAARPGEAAAIRPRDVDRSDPRCWIYRPGSHKTEHHGRERIIVLGPRAQEVLRPWLLRDPDAYCFSPAEVVAARAPGRGGRRGSRRGPGLHYTKDSYRVAIARACDRAFPHPTLAEVRFGGQTEEQRGELRDWRRAHR